ncbi:hypothetical protein R6Q57_028539 [Mikania cordata]
MKPESETRSAHKDEPKYKGVRKRKWGKWVSEIRLPNSRERIWLGSYDSPVKAARAFDAASFCLRGSAAKFNFPDQPPNIPNGTSLSSSEIQAAAARFANLQVPEDAVVVEPMDQTDTSASDSLVTLHDDETNYNSNNVMDYDIFPGFDDYFMQPPPQFPDYYEDNNGDITQAGPSFLWNY